MFSLLRWENTTDKLHFYHHFGNQMLKMIYRQKEWLILGTLAAPVSSMEMLILSPNGLIKLPFNRISFWNTANTIQRTYHWRCWRRAGWGHAEPSLVRSPHLWGPSWRRAVRETNVKDVMQFQQVVCHSMLIFVSSQRNRNRGIINLLCGICNQKWD